MYVPFVSIMTRKPCKSAYLSARPHNAKLERVHVDGGRDVILHCCYLHDCLPNCNAQSTGIVPYIFYTFKPAWGGGSETQRKHFREREDIIYMIGTGLTATRNGTVDVGGDWR
jgi:hypothetical protein